MLYVPVILSSCKIETQPTLASWLKRSRSSLRLSSEESRLESFSKDSLVLFHWLRYDARDTLTTVSGGREQGIINADFFLLLVALFCTGSTQQSESGRTSFGGVLGFVAAIILAASSGDMVKSADARKSARSRSTSDDGSTRLVSRCLARVELPSGRPGLRFLMGPSVRGDCFALDGGCFLVYFRGFEGMCQPPALAITLSWGASG
mmetsp:Transcript_23641/g.51411  ORF Transcript_23641/g.51411 Transcript_23641/m.51411 type:complete len:206 (-) Transcript_23641:1123-1740(-)